MGTTEDLEKWYQNIGHNGVYDMLVKRIYSGVRGRNARDQVKIRAYVEDQFIVWNHKLKTGKLINRNVTPYRPIPIPDTEAEYVQLVGKMFNNTFIGWKIINAIVPRIIDRKSVLYDPDEHWVIEGNTPETLVIQIEDKKTSEKEAYEMRVILNAFADTGPDNNLIAKMVEHQIKHQLQVTKLASHFGQSPKFWYNGVDRLRTFSRGFRGEQK